MTPKTLHNTTASQARKNVKDLVIWGDGDAFKLICKASSESEGWMKSTKAMEVEDVGVFLQVTTLQRDAQGGHAIAESVTYAPGIKIWENLDEDGEVTSRSLVAL